MKKILTEIQETVKAIIGKFSDLAMGLVKPIMKNLTSKHQQYLELMKLNKCLTIYKVIKHHL